MKDTLKRETVYLVSCRDLFDLVEQVYGVPVEADAIANDTAYYINNVNYQVDPVRRTETLKEIQNHLIRVRPSTGEQVDINVDPHSFSVLLQDLVNLKKLHSGSYVIEVMW